MCGGIGLGGPLFGGRVHPHSPESVVGGRSGCPAAAPLVVVLLLRRYWLAVRSGLRCWPGLALGPAAVAAGRCGGPRRKEVFPLRAVEFGGCVPWTPAVALLLVGRGG